MEFNTENINAKIKISLKDIYEEDVLNDIVFHMTDWINDLKLLCKFYQAPEKFNAEETENLLMSFLNHVPNHIAAASKLMTGFGVSDVFKIGAIEK